MACTSEEEKMRSGKNGFLLAGFRQVLGILCLMSLLGFLPPEHVCAESASMLETALLKVGKADAIVITDGSHTMIIDAGENEDGDEVVDYLEKRGISRVDVLLITHFDKDHVGGADTVIDCIQVDRVLMPDYPGSGEAYERFMDALIRNQISPERLTGSVQFQFGEAEVLVEPPNSYEITGSGEYDNDFSLITTVVHGENRLVFAGDIEKKRIREWLEGGTVLPCDFLKVPHHGNYNAALEQLFDALMPRYAAICSSDKNPADDRVLELLRERNVVTAETRRGNIYLASDGTELSMHQ